MGEELELILLGTRSLSSLINGRIYITLTIGSHGKGKLKCVTSSGSPAPNVVVLPFACLAMAGSGVPSSWREAPGFPEGLLLPAAGGKFSSGCATGCRTMQREDLEEEDAEERFAPCKQVS